MTITHKGQKAEEIFRLKTGATKPIKPGLGDAEFYGNFIEIKQTSSGTINQIRAVKYITLVIYDENKNIWYIVPAHEVVKLVAHKKRGQHTENPFESANINIKDINQKYLIKDETELATKTNEAIENAKKFNKIKEAMQEVIEKSKNLAHESKRKVQDLLDQIKDEI